MGDSDMEKLPERCIAHVISLTSPRDACCASAVSSAFRSATASDTVWDRFLPPDCLSLLSRAIHPVEFASKRDLFFRLCDSVLIDGGTMSFSLDRRSGAKCFMLSALKLAIEWGGTPQYWSWGSMPDSRFSEVAILRNVCWLEIRGKIDSRMLSRKTTYAVYFIYKLASWADGLDCFLQEVYVRIGAHSSTKTVRLQPGAQEEAEEIHWQPGAQEEEEEEEAEEVHLQPGAQEVEEEEEAEEEEEEADEVGGDGWMEVEMGEFYNDEGEDGEVDMILNGVQGEHWKRGLIVEGIQIRPKE